MSGPATPDASPDIDVVSAPTPEDERHRVLSVLLRTQFVASSIGVAIAFALYESPENASVFVSCALVLGSLGVMAFAPMSYLARARGYTAAFVLLAGALAVLGGPQASTFLVM